MAEDVIIRGNLVDFLGNQKCEACQERGRDCIMREGAEACLLCLDSGKACIFQRIVQIRGPPKLFKRGYLIADDGIVELDQHPIFFNFE